MRPHSGDVMLLATKSSLVVFTSVKRGATAANVEGVRVLASGPVHVGALLPPSPVRLMCPLAKASAPKYYGVGSIDVFAHATTATAGHVCLLPLARVHARLSPRMGYVAVNSFVRSAAIVTATADGTSVARGVALVNAHPVASPVPVPLPVKTTSACYHVTLGHAILAKRW